MGGKQAGIGWKRAGIVWKQAGPGLQLEAGGAFARQRCSLRQAGGWKWVGTGACGLSAPGLGMEGGGARCSPSAHCGWKCQWAGMGAMRQRWHRGQKQGGNGSDGGVGLIVVQCDNAAHQEWVV